MTAFDLTYTRATHQVSIPTLEHRLLKWFETHGAFEGVSASHGGVIYVDAKRENLVHARKRLLRR